MEKTGPQIGGKIRRLRRQKHTSQADLAAALGISASYLNLLEHNRRNITVPLLFKLAGHFGIEPGELVESDESQLTGDLMELFGDDIFADTDLTNHEIRDLASSNPTAAKAILRLFDKYQEVRSGRSGGESASDAEPSTTGYHMATEAISDFIQENANHFPALEASAERVRHDIDHASDSFELGLKTYLFNVFGFEVKMASLPAGIAQKLDEDTNKLFISDISSPESALFSMAHRAALLTAEREIEEIVDQSNLPEGDAPILAKNVLASYFAAALVMPYTPFLAACRDYRYDVERLSRRFGASFEQVCHRMTTLQRPGAQGIPLHLVRTDIAGNISKRFSLSGIHIPRHSGACPRWNIYSAFLQPEKINIQISQMPDSEMYFCIAKSIAKGGYRHNAPRRHLSIGLGCHISHAKEMIYSDGVDLKNLSQVVPIGVGCRICPRLECGQRAHPPADHRFHIDAATKPENLYAKMS
ncbi:helix-turn-helix domain-containing protein [Maritalea porphyrae]|uniref:Transcriptional regulator n=1 Tax=Maritalea porphyrae TaxID=880732 RepID=A0ABQ5UQN3_9HYPH|nr:XRE family transcriptional regulator [Maritalea porphyrae]GLQ16913.1 transcriptional regulator [Maritalea porphyrae]